MGGKDPRVREHNTRQLMAALWGFCSHFKVGFAPDWFKKRISFGKCNRLHIKSSVSIGVTSLLSLGLFTGPS